MANSSLKNKVLSFSPHIEMIVRRLYWRNIKKFNRAKSSPHKVQSAPVDFNKITQFIELNGGGRGRLLLVHSAYAPFKGRGKTPNQLIDMLLDIVGKDGTLAMPAMAKFKNDRLAEEYLKFKPGDEVFHYDVQKSGVKTGVLPLMLHKRESSIRSRFPINTMVALGPLAEKLFNSEFNSEDPLPCGDNSSWKKCVDENALIIGLGTDLTHSLTSIHVAEDASPKSWPVDGWYRYRRFKITDKTYGNEVVLKERDPKWGALHYAERTLCKDLLKAGILKSTVIDGILVEVIESSDLLEFLESRNSNGYPYFWLN